MTYQIVHILLALLAILPGMTGPRQSVPAGTILNVRLTMPLASYSAHVNQPVVTVLIAPVTIDDRTAIPAGVQVIGHVAQVRKVGLGFVHERAGLNIQFDRLVLADGATFDIRGRVTTVDNAREQVDSKGTIVGIVATQGFSRRTTQLMQSLAAFEPWIALPFGFIESTLLEAPDPEIHFPAGTELALRLTSPAEVPLRDTSEADSWPATGWGSADEHMVASLDYRTITPKANRPSDVTNILFLGSREQIGQAFERAGWVATDPVSFHTGASTFMAVAHNHGFSDAPMSILLLDGHPQDMMFQKALNTVSKRHHLRIWREPVEWRGQEVWASSSTRDVRIGFSSGAFTHRIAEDIDAERTKVVNDLSFAGCVAGVRMVERPDVPAATVNSTGDPIVTDGEMAVVQLKACTGPAESPTMEAEAQRVHGTATQRITRRFVLTVHNYVRRSNPVCTTFELVRALGHANGRLYAKLPRRSDGSVMLLRRRSSLQ